MVKNQKNRKPGYRLDPKNKEFIIENYNLAKPFANFFPGIAGKYGIPMWVFYVNRGQGIASFGTKDKDRAILEFFPANKAWQMVSLHGFRTFIKIYTAGSFLLYEPFHNGFTNLGYKLANRMRLTSYGMSIEEDNISLGISVKVEYFTIPNDSYSALARIVTVKNMNTSAKKMQMIDGLPQIVPFGTNDLFLKKLGRTVEAWMNIENLDKDVPFYKLDVDPSDRPEVVHIKEGNFYLGFSCEQGKPKIIKPIVDPESVFGAVTDLSCPVEFLSKRNFIHPIDKLTKNKMPCGMSLLGFELKKNAEKNIYSIIGYMRSRQILNSTISRIASAEYILQKKEENKKIIEELQEDITTESSSKELDLYTRQTYLDNIMRGGYPAIFKSGHRESVFYMYSRKHGDLERDYNKFQTQPAYFSQGNGNYRDMNQNRRTDVWFNPAIKDDNITTFFNLIQTDGFNPLVIKGITFTLEDKDGFGGALKDMVNGDTAKLASLLDKPFTPGDVILFIKENKIKLNISYDEFLNILLSRSRKNQEAEHGEGFWTDHWAYNIDLLISYLGVYPEKLRELICEKRDFTFYDNAEIVKPRAEKYVLYDGKPRQLHSVRPSSAKKELIKKRGKYPNTVRTEYGRGNIYRTTLINKLLCLAVNKLASLDPFGCGIEMEADKPNWFDALNGLPGLFGSSVNETFELKRMLLFIKDAVDKCAVEKITVSEEISAFLFELDKLIKEYLCSPEKNKDYDYWDKSYSLKEGYREKTKFGVSGKEDAIETGWLSGFLTDSIKKIECGVDKAFDKKTGIYCSYFINEVSEYTLASSSVKPTRFKQTRLPLFLEAQVHALRLNGDADKAKALYEAVKKSGLYDKKLKMYKSTVSLIGAPEEIGRCRVFTPGWLEHESIWLHMEYKFLLETLKSGLYKEFYKDFTDILIPFQDPKRYGRSILENSSFLVSSAFPDKNLHGNGFVARLSGSTAEFLHIWLIMNAGHKPFLINEKGELNLRLQPILAGWLFGGKNKTYSFNFLSKVKVVYHNPAGKDTFGKNAALPARICFKDSAGGPVEITSNTIPHPYAQQVRSRQINQIDIYLE
ncbi:MAG: cellobiose phosphorylase [Candidatus Omnitrophota bacterium]|jgi:hypothetical protein